MTGALVYGCTFGANKCVWYPLGSNTVAGTITGLSNPQGVTSGGGPNTDIYIANTGASEVRVYPKGSTTLKTALADTNEYPVSVAVASDGTVYVANIFSTSHHPGNVTVFDRCSKTISRTINDPHFYEVISDAIDENQDLVVCYNRESGGAACDEFPNGRGTGTTIVSGLGFAGGVAFDSSEDLVVADQAGPTTLVYRPNDGALCKTFAGASPTFALDSLQGDLLVVDVGSGDIIEETYSGCSGGGAHEFKYSAGGPATSAAVDPGPPN
jgi:hypothetical protein